MPAVASWLAAGAVATAVLYWLFLNTPESNVLTLSASAVLVVIMVLVAASVVNGALLLALAVPFRTALTAGLRRVHWFIVAALPAVLIVWAVRRGDAWIERHAGEISAWFIATLGWADATPLFRVERYLSVWVRWVVVPVLTLAASTGLLRHGVRGIASSRWLRAALHWRTLTIATAAFVLLMVLPWRLVAWRPHGLPPTWLEPAAAAARLLLVAGALAIAAAVVVTTVARASDTRQR